MWNNFFYQIDEFLNNLVIHKTHSIELTKYPNSSYMYLVVPEWIKYQISDPLNKIKYQISDPLNKIKYQIPHKKIKYQIPLKKNQISAPLKKSNII